MNEATSKIHTSYKAAEDALKAVHQFMAEFDGARTVPNVLFINKFFYESVKKFFPYYLEEDLFLCNGISLKIIISETPALGLAFSLHTDFILR